MIEILNCSPDATFFLLPKLKFFYLILLIDLPITSENLCREHYPSHFFYSLLLLWYFGQSLDVWPRIISVDGSFFDLWMHTSWQLKLVVSMMLWWIFRWKYSDLRSQHACEWQKWNSYLFQLCSCETAIILACLVRNFYIVQAINTILKVTNIWLSLMQKPTSMDQLLS